MSISVLFKQGMKKRAIAKHLGISVNTVRRYLKLDKDDAGPTKKEKWLKLKPYMAYLKQRVEAASPQRLPSTVLFQEIVDLGYCGKIRQLRYYLTEIVPSEPIEPLNRFETERGCQMQVDWVEFRRGKNRLSAFVATLGYSRASYVEFVVDEKLPTLLACHQHAFAYFGGVPKDILYDNMKTIVTQRDAYGEGKHRFQKNFWDFAKHYGFMPRLCRPHRARTKGKVERFNHYLRYSFYVPLASRLKLSGIELDKQTANSEVKRWLNTTANQRIHGTTGKIPAVLLLEEQLVFQILPPPYEGQAVDAVIDETPVSIEIFPVMHQHPLSTYDALLH